MASELWGLLAEFEGPETLTPAVDRLRQAGVDRIETYTPYPLTEPEATRQPYKHAVPLAALLAGASGAAVGYSLQWYSSALHFPFLVGGKPYAGWPPMMVVTLLLGILSAVVAAVVAMLMATRLPQPHHPLFAAPGFEHASCDGFFLSIGPDTEIGLGKARILLEEAGARRIVEVSP